MPVNISKNTIKTVSYPSVSNTLMSCDTNVIVPDSKPDAREVVVVSVRPLIGEKRVQKDYITLSGNLDYELMYTPEGGDCPVGVSTRVPFTHQIEMAGGEGAHISVKCNVVSVSAVAVNSRKINIKSVIDFETNAVLSSSFEIASEKGCDMPCRTDSVNCSCLASFCERDFEVGGALTLGGGAPAEILATRGGIDCREIKFINGKPVAKGIVRAAALYTDEEGKRCIAEGDFPFTEPLGCDGEGTSREVDFVMTDGQFAITSEGGGSGISATFSYTLCAFIYEDCKAEVISDIYSPEFDLETDRRDISFCHITSVREECPVKETIPLMSGNEAVAVFSTTVTPEIEDIRSTPSGTEAVGKAAILLCCVDREGNVCTAKKELPFACSLGVSAEDKDRISVVVEAESISAGLISPNMADVRYTLCFDTKVAGAQDLSCICDVRAIECEDKKVSAPSVLLYFPSAGEKLWDVAKEYRTTVDAISQANGRDFGEVFGEGEVVMIPRRG